MKFRLGLITGLTIGFLLGARAGRERYDQIVATYNKIRSNDAVRRTTDLAEQSTRKTRTAAGNTLVRTADTIRQRAAR
ncbi:MAG: YtxH domain-containing protein [Actinomycetota bacterium]